MSARKWHKGPPPHVGWWEASTNQNRNVWRWWCGSSWSEFSTPCETPYCASLIAKYNYYSVKRMEWTYYWPENARVPRINPRKAK
jgi:hypothetical protein